MRKTNHILTVSICTAFLFCTFSSISVAAMSSVPSEKPAEKIHPTLSAHPAWEKDITGASVDASVCKKEIHVSVTKGNDDAPGTQEQPKKTVASALKLAQTHCEGGTPVKVVIHPGMYREMIHMDFKNNDTPLCIEGTDRDTVIFTGSANWSAPEKWKKIPEHPGIYRTPWHKDWGDYDVKSYGQPASGGPHLAAIANDDCSVSLVWSKPEKDESYTYKIYRKSRIHDQTVRYDNPKGKVTKTEYTCIASNLTKRAFRDADVKPSETWVNVTYWYKISAIDAKGNETGYSQEIRVNTGDDSDASRPRRVGRRKEMVFVNDLCLTQVLSFTDLTPGTFFVNDGFPTILDDGWMYICPPADAKIGDAKIEVSVRPDKNWTAGLLTILNKKNIIVRNLTFQHTATRVFNSSAFRLHECVNVVVENVRAAWNSGGGISARLHSITIKDCISEFNGGSGMGWGGGTNVVVDNCRVNNNNWRGDMSDIRGWFFAGIKTGFGMRGCLVRNLTTYSNYCHGLWFDYNNKRILVDGLKSFHNDGFGIYIEACHGPFIVRSSEFAYNTSAGIHLANSADGVLCSNVLYDNDGCQLSLLHRLDRPVTISDISTASPVEGETYHYVPLNISNWVWRNNVIVSTDILTPLIHAPPFPFIYETLKSVKNLWYTPAEDQSFEISNLRYSFRAWQEFTGQDLDSIFANPEFTAPEKLDFTPKKNSPLFSSDTWPVIKVDDVGMHQLDTRVVVAAKNYNKTPYPTITPDSHWESITLKGVANRPLTGKDSWIGYQLPQLKPGKTTYHCVPFTIINEKENNGFAGIAMRSAKMQSSRGKALAAQTTLPVGSKCKEVYFLHGCGFASAHEPAVRYEIVYEDGTKESIDIIPFGKGSDDTDALKDLEKSSNIQDWWPTFYHFNNDLAKKTLVYDEKEPMKAARYLYTLQFPNPHPEKSIKEIVFSSVDPGKDVSVMVVGVTLRK